MHRSRVFRGLSSFLLIAVLLATVPFTVSANNDRGEERGNSGNVHACKDGKWKTLYRMEDSTTFRNQGDCVAHGARGGRLVDTPLLWIFINGYDPDYIEGAGSGVVDFKGDSTGLLPGSAFSIVSVYRNGTSITTTDTIGLSGTFSLGWTPFCYDAEQGSVLDSITAYATAADGTPLSLTLKTPCL